MAIVNRLSPLIVRRTGASATVLPVPAAIPFEGADPGAWLEDLKLFATGWIGGLVFFATLFG